MEEILDLLLEVFRGIARAVCILIHVVTIPAGFICMIDAANIQGKERSETTRFEERKKRTFFFLACASLILLIISAKLLSLLTNTNLFGLYFSYSIVLLVFTLYSLVTPE